MTSVIETGAMPDNDAAMGVAFGGVTVGYGLRWGRRFSVRIGGSSMSPFDSSLSMKLRAAKVFSWPVCVRQSQTSQMCFVIR
mgnify:CR=1 FL=1